MGLKDDRDRLAKELCDSLEKLLRGKKLFTEEQLAGVSIGVSFDLPDHLAQAFTSTADKMVEPETSEGEDHLNIPKSRDMLKAAAVWQDRLNRTAKHLMDDTLGTADKPVYKNIIEAIRTLQHAAWENSKAHGWNEAVDNPASALMMITREVSELAEEERDASSGESTKIPGFSKKEEEAADIAIRLLSYCGARNMRLGAAICAKHEFNKTRPYRHGDKLF